MLGTRAQLGTPGWEWSRHRWGMLDATAKDDNRSPALQHKGNVLYPPTARWASESPQGQSALPGQPLNQPSAEEQTA